MENTIKSLPMVALRGMTIMPEMVVHFDVSRERSVAAIQEAMAEEQKIFLTAQKSIDTEDPKMEDVYEIGTVGTIKQIIKLPKHIVRVLVSGEMRGRLKEIEYTDLYLRANVELLDDSEEILPEDVNTEAMERGLKDMFVSYAAKNGKMSKEAVSQLVEMKGLRKLVDEIAANIPLYYTDQQDILNETDLLKRYEKLAFKLVNEVQIIDIKEEIQRKVKERVDKHQREYILREQLKLIREELGEESTASDAEEFEKDDREYPYQVISDKESLKTLLNLYVEKYYDENDDKQAWFDKIKELAGEMGYAKEVKEYKANPDAYPGHVGDVSTAIRVTLTKRTNTPDMYEIMQVLRKDEVIKRLRQ